MFRFCCRRILLASAYYKNLNSQAQLFKKLDIFNQKFMNNQYTQYPLKRSLKPSEGISAFRFMARNTNRVFTMFWFCTNCKLCLTHGHDFSKATYPAVRNPVFILQNYHLNLLRCRCRNTKLFSASLNNCLGKLVLAITDQNAWAFGDESPRQGNMNPV